MKPRRLQSETSFSRTVASDMEGAPKTKRHPAFRRTLRRAFGPRRHVQNLDAECRDESCGNPAYELGRDQAVAAFVPGPLAFSTLSRLVNRLRLRAAVFL